MAVRRSAPLPRLAVLAMEAPAVLGVSDDFFREHIAPHVPCVRLGTKKLYAIAALERYLERNAAMTLGDGEVTR
jgi:hypothetical protein